MKITVLGAGAWGTALARMLAMQNHQVTLWDFFPETVEAIRRTQRNERYLPGIELPPNLRAEADAAKAVAGA
jgi:glycerol-3-phosphate dehydrogenase (NAD(P)+)